MSQYLIDQIAKTPNIQLRGPVRRSNASKAKVAWNGSRWLHSTTARAGWRSLTRSLSLSAPVRVVTGFLLRVLRDAKGFVLTGRDLMAAEAYPRIWKEPREPLPLETSEPGLFAAGDLRAGAMNRVASAVGEGSMVVWLAREYLALT